MSTISHVKPNDGGFEKKTTAAPAKDATAGKNNGGYELRVTSTEVQT